MDKIIIEYQSQDNRELSKQLISASARVLEQGSTFKIHTLERKIKLWTRSDKIIIEYQPQDNRELSKQLISASVRVLEQNNANKVYISHLMQRNPHGMQEWFLGMREVKINDRI